jgi:hypothetical protein
MCVCNKVLKYTPKCFFSIFSPPQAATAYGESFVVVRMRINNVKFLNEVATVNTRVYGVLLAKSLFVFYFLLNLRT